MTRGQQLTQHILSRTLDDANLLLLSQIVLVHAAFMRVGLWEPTAYVLICAVTLPKSLYVADSFPARAWSEVRSLRSLVMSRAERVLAGFSLLCLLVATWEEAFTPV
jgi:hypothetical protein